MLHQYSSIVFKVSRKLFHLICILTVSPRFVATKVKALFRAVTDTFAVDFGAFLRFFTPIRCVSHCISNTYPFLIWSRLWFIFYCLIVLFVLMLQR